MASSVPGDHRLTLPSARSARASSSASSNRQRVVVMYLERDKMSD
jgi:hypothetical protein